MYFSLLKLQSFFFFWSESDKHAKFFNNNNNNNGPELKKFKFCSLVNGTVKTKIKQTKQSMAVISHMLEQVYYQLKIFELAKAPVCSC